MKGKQTAAEKPGFSPLRWLARKADIVLLGSRNFFATDHLQQATALTYYTLFAIVPLVALFFGIAKGFELQGLLRSEINRRLAVLPQATLDRIYEFAENMLRQSSGGIIAGVGVLVLLWTVLRLAGNIEKSFNLIWHVRRGRGFFRKISDYLSLLIVAPISLIVISSTMLFADKLTARFTGQWKLIDRVGLPFFTVALEQLFPLLLAMALFTFIYVFVPNTHVRFRSAIFAGFVSALLYLAAQLVYFHAQGALFQNKIYGSLALLPLFLIWVQWSWMIALLGSEIAFVDQNYSTGQFDRQEHDISEEQRQKYAITLGAIIFHAFEAGERPVSEATVVRKTGFPLFRVRELLSDLVDAGIIFRLGDDVDGEPAFLPGVPTDKLTVLDVMQKLERRGINHEPPRNFSEYTQIDSAMRNMSECAAASPMNKLLRDIA